MPRSDFDWRSDAEHDWEDLPLIPPFNKPASPRWRLRGGLVGLFIISLALVIVYLLLDNRVDKAVTQTEEEVLLAHALVLEAVEAQDYELYQSLLSDQQRTWYDNQPELLSLGLFWGRSALGLEPVMDGGAANDGLEITLDPELNRAEVAQTRPFVVTIGAGITDTVRLERTFMYVRLDEGWYLTGMEDNSSFWGIWERQPGEVLTLVYPERDAETGQKLAPLLDELVTNLCREQEMKCPDNFQLELKLDRDEQTLFRLSELFRSTRILARDGRGSLVMPAPSVTGRPVDNAGFQALAHGYGTWLGAVLINNFAVLDNNYEISVIADLLSTYDYSLPPWPQSMMPRPAAEKPEGAFVPQQDILMLCTGGNQQRLLRFNTAEAVWINEWPFKAIWASGPPSAFPGPNMRRLPDYSGVLVTFLSETDGTTNWRTFLWKNGQDELWLDHDEAAYFWQPQSVFTGDPNGRFLSGYYLSIENNSRMVDSWWLDLEACAEGACAQQGADGVPLWSPSGEYTLLTTMAPYEKPELYLGDSEANSFLYLGGGFPVGWIDEQTFVYLRQQVPVASDPTGHGIWQELVIRKIGPGIGYIEDPQLIIDGQGLKEGIALERQSYEMGIVAALPYKDGWLVAARELGRGVQAGSYLFFYQPQTGALTSVYENEMEMTLPPLLMGIGGPYVSVFALGNNEFYLRLIDPESGQVVYEKSQNPADWSSDKKWLLFAEEGRLRIAAPALDYEWTIDHHLADCNTAVWVNREL